MELYGPPSTSCVPPFILKASGAWHKAFNATLPTLTLALRPQICEAIHQALNLTNAGKITLIKNLPYLCIFHHEKT